MQDGREKSENFGTENYGTELMLDEEDDYDEEDAQTIREVVDGELANLTEGADLSSSSEDEMANQESNVPFSMTDKAEEIEQNPTADQKG